MKKLKKCDVQRIDKDLLQIKIAECFERRGCKIEFDRDDFYGWLYIRAGICIYPDDLVRLRKLLYVSNILATIDYSSSIPMPYVEICCCYKDVVL